MTADYWTRLAIIASFDEARPSFLAAMDQIVSEMRPLVNAQSAQGNYSDSVISCAAAFANTALVRSQLTAAVPDIVGNLTDAEIENAHLATISYLFSLALHEIMRAPQPLFNDEDRS